MPNFYSFTVKDKSLKPFNLEQFKGQAILVVNVASKCGFTPQYAGLEKLYKEFKDKGFTILAFPCNQFGSQEPGSNEEISEFCSLNYGVSFPVLDKVEVNGENTAEVYSYLKKELPGILGTEKIKWNFTKFLIDKSGKPVKRYGSNTKPEAIKADIQKVLDV